MIHNINRAPDKERIFIFIMFISSPNPMFDHLLESSHRDDSNKWSNIGFGEEITKIESVEVNFTHLIWSSVLTSIFRNYLLFDTLCTSKYILVKQYQFEKNIHVNQFQRGPQRPPPLPNQGLHNLPTCF